MTTVAMMQPSFLPWQGLFELILNSDKFIFLDDFQFSVQSHHTRNKLFVNKNQVDYYNIPVQKSKCFELRLNEVLIVKDNRWKNKLLRTLEYNYKKSRNFEDIHPQIENIINSNIEILAQMNMSLIKEFCRILKIETTFLNSSDFTRETNSKAKRSQRVMELLEWADGDKYLSAYGSFNYMKEDNFDFNKYNTLFQNFIPKPYNQIHSEIFVPYLSVLDALYNIGSAKTLELIKSGTEQWLTPDDIPHTGGGATLKALVALVSSVLALDDFFKREFRCCNA